MRMGDESLAEWITKSGSRYSTHNVNDLKRFRFVSISLAIAPSFPIDRTRKITQTSSCASRVVKRGFHRTDIFDF